MVWRRDIINTLINEKITGNIIKFINNFLQERYIKVRVNGSLSNIYQLDNGIPQGSVLSGTLFLLSINELLKMIQNPAIKTCFVDKCNICISGKNLTLLQELAQQNLNHVQSFSEDKGFRFSLFKTSFIIFSRHRKVTESIQLQMNGQNLEEKDELKILGLIMDKKLTWIPHIKKLKQQCAKKLNIIKVLSSNSWVQIFS